MDNFSITYEAWIQSLVLALAMLVTWIAGWWIGRRVSSDQSEPAAAKADPGGSKFDSANMALLGLLLAFTFSMSLSRHEKRMMMVVADSNAIGDFYTCASLLKEPVRTNLQTVIRQYGELHMQMARQRFDRFAWENALRRNQLLHAGMTKLVSQAISDGTPIAVPLTSTLNEVTSKFAARLAAVEDRVPGSVVLMLFAFAVMTTTLDGLEQGTRGVSSPMEAVGMLSFILLVTLAVYVTLDLNQPERGLITVSQASIERLLSSMAN